uniref:Restriction endonuclease-like protein n=1 Tax=Rhodopseudomonas palustris (strain BisA53) TaxID=316055 RepID=Q07U56_RHOP5
MNDLSDLAPSSKPLVIDLVKEAGVDVSEWKNFKGKNPATNPKHCYNWSFRQGNELVVALFFHEDLTLLDGAIVHDQNIRLRDGRLGGSGAAQWRKRATELDQNLKLAYQKGLPIRAIILGGEKRDHLDAESRSSVVQKRLLDPVPWAVTRYDMDTGKCVVVRGAMPISSTDQDDPEIQGFEGEVRRYYILHRRREASLRTKKIQAALWENSGVLRCEVPRCGFDFKNKYGELGSEFAHVHHLKPLSESPIEGRVVGLHEFAIVCANCHAMIHRGGQCRPLAGLIPAAGL